MTETRPCPGLACDTALGEVEFLCRKCQHRAEKALGDLPALTRDLEHVTVARQDHIQHASSGKARTPDEDWRGSTHALVRTPWPADVNASQRGRDVLELLFEWADHIAHWYDQRGMPLFTQHRPLTELVPYAVAMILGHSDWMRTAEQGPDLANAIHCIRRDLRRIVDVRPARLYAGPCNADLGYGDGLGYTCGLSLFRQWGADDIACDAHQPSGAVGWWPSTGCEHTHLAADRTEHLRASVEEHLLPLRLLWESLYLLEPKASGIDWKTVQQWTKERRQRTVIGVTATGRDRVKIHVTPARLAAAGHDGKHPLYRGADVLALARDTGARRGRKRTRGERIAS